MSQPSELMPPWVRWLTAYNRAWFTALLKRIERIEETPAIAPRVIRNVTDASRYCGFKSSETFLTWARRVGFEIPKTKLTQQARPAFLVDDLDAAILRDPSLCRNKRRLPKT